MPDPLRYGILSTGNIARQFCAGVASARQSKVVAVASRSMQSARAFAEQFEVISAYGAYEHLLQDRSVDAVYVALPNAMHHEWTIRSLQAGKHVLCEKPIALSTQQAEEMFSEADRAGKVLAEGFMYLSHPQTAEVRAAVLEGLIGELRLIRTNFCFRIRRTENNIRFNRDLGGGAMMDVGCYCTSLACLFADSDPVQIAATAQLHSSGVDEATSGFLRFNSGLISTFSCGMRVQCDNAAYLCGTEGFIQIPVPWKPAAKSTWTLAQNIPPKQDQPEGAAPPTPPRQTRTVEAGMELYAMEADEFAAAVQEGAAPRVSRELTLRNMRILDEVRRQIGVM